MYRIVYRRGTVSMTVYDPLDSRYSVTSAVYSRETNTIGKLTFSLLHDHPFREELDEYIGTVHLLWNGKLLYSFRIIGIRRDFFNRLSVTCEGLLGYLNDSVVRPYTFNASSAIYPTADMSAHRCTPAGFLKELINMHNIQVKPSQQFGFTDATNGAFDDIGFTVSQTSYTTTWKEIEEKIINNVGGYLQYSSVNLTPGDGGYSHYLVYRATLSDTNAQAVRFSVNLKDLETDTGTAVFATALHPVSTYTDENGQQHTLEINGNEVNDGKYYVQHNAAVAAHGRIIAAVRYEGISSAYQLKAIAQRDLSAYITRGRQITASALDMTAIDSTATPLEVDRSTRIISEPNGVNTSAMLNAFEVDLLDPSASRFTFNGEVPSFVRKKYLYT